MNKIVYIRLICVWAIWGSALNLFAQISPGKLTEAHAHLEGMANCTACHDLGNKVPDSKCLACHKEIDQLIKKDRGFHASVKVRSRDCVTCHNEHHGRKFQMIRFDEENFDHNLAKYALKGKHASIDCRSCHKPDNISDREIQRRKGTFLGLSSRCLSCHDDYHQQTLGNKCAKCHDFKAFKPASLFDHGDADFHLKGAHLNVECKKCHPLVQRGGKLFQQFVDIEFADCSACHEDPHLGGLPGKCSVCHAETSFDDFKGRGKFDHKQTGFILKGKHAEISCFKCHKRSRNPEDLFVMDFGSISERNCAKCHKDVHEGKFGKDCASCHRESSFFSLRNMKHFNHDVTDFPLRGKHVGVKCKACHKRRYTDPINFSRCDYCHKDYHRGDFKRDAKQPDCGDCHSVEEPFSFTTFGFEDHQKARFALEGAHIATPCFSCHLENDRWVFSSLGARCIDCHKDIHAGFINQKFYPDKDCTACHKPDSWTDIHFDHEITDWPLDGRHLGVACSACHLREQLTSSKKTQVFKNLDSHCMNCHEDVHDNQFAERQMERGCASCHTPDDWFPRNFNHTETAFPLDGKHKDLECGACHFKNVGDDVIIYKMGKTKCIDCHS